MTPRQNLRGLKWLALCFVIVLAGCGSAGSRPVDTGAPTSGAAAAPTAAPARPTQGSVAEPTAAPSGQPAPIAATEAPIIPAATAASGATSAGAFVVPSEA